MSGQRQSWGTLCEVSSGTWRTWRTPSRFSSLSSSASSSRSDCGEESEQVPHRLNRAGCPQELYSDDQRGGDHFITWFPFGWISTLICNVLQCFALICNALQVKQMKEAISKPAQGERLAVRKFPTFAFQQNFSLRFLFKTTYHSDLFSKLLFLSLS